MKYIIKNVGGDIRYGTVQCEKVLIVTIYDKHSDYVGKGYIYLNGYWKNNFSKYDFESSSFELYLDLEPNPVSELKEKIEEVITSQGFYCLIESSECLDFIYTNYKQEMIRKTMITRFGIICNIENNEDYEFKIYANLDDLDNLDDGQISNIITKELEKLIFYNGS